jgi:hypothetical protein
VTNNDPRFIAVQQVIRNALDRAESDKRHEILWQWIAADEFENGGTLLWNARTRGWFADLRKDKKSGAEHLLLDFDFTTGDLVYAKDNRRKLLAPLLGEEQTRLLEAMRASMTKSISTLRDQHEKAEQAWTNKWQRLKRFSKVRRRIRSKSGVPSLSRIDWLYFALFILIVVFIGFLVWLGSAEKPKVSIEFKVGEIIAGILAGTGVLLAGGAYAVKTMRDSAPGGGER